MLTLVQLQLSRCLCVFIPSLLACRVPEEDCKRQRPVHWAASLGASLPHQLRALLPLLSLSARSRQRGISLSLSGYIAARLPVVYCGVLNCVVLCCAVMLCRGAVARARVEGKQSLLTPVGVAEEAKDVSNINRPLNQVRSACARATA